MTAMLCERSRCRGAGQEGLIRWIACPPSCCFICASLMVLRICRGVGDMLLEARGSNPHGL